MRLLHLRLIQPTVQTIQAGILIGHYLGGGGDVRGKFIYIGIARRHAQSIRLWDVPENSSIISRDICRRTWLSVVIAEKWSAADMATYPTTLNGFGPLLPFLDNIDFMAMQPGIQESQASLQPPAHGLWVQMAATIDIFRHINDITQNLGCNTRSIQPYQQEISLLNHRLDRWSESLPADLKYSAANLANFAAAGLGRTLLSMHIGYHHICQFQYYLFLGLEQEQQPGEQLDQMRSYEEYARLCKEHAIIVSDIARLASQTSGCVTAGNLGYRKALIVLSYRNSKLGKEREREEVCGHYISTLAWSRLYKCHTSEYQT
jgi:hypothetical protein